MDNGLTGELESSELSKRYGRLIVEAIEGVLDRSLGHAIRELIYTNLQHEYGFDTEACQRNVEEFIMALRRILGKNASIMIERMVVKQLCISLNLKNIDENLSLLDFIERLKRLQVDHYGTKERILTP